MANPPAPKALLTAVLGDAYGERAGPEAPAAVMDLRVVDDGTIAEMNRRYLDHDGPTDVLAFDDGEADDELPAIHLGDVAISADTARREAARRGVDPAHELTLYALHGLLHLSGMRDHDAESRQAMIALQGRILRRHGLPYDMDGEGAPPPDRDESAGDRQRGSNHVG